MLGLFVTTALAGAAALAYYSLPELSAKLLMRAQRGISGLRRRRVRVGSHEVTYLEGGAGEPVLLLHGIFAEKDHWNDFARALVRHHRVIVPDLPGFGESTRLQDQCYDYAAQTPRLLAFTAALQLPEFHVAGSSMGATLAALLAIQHPQRVSTVAFVGAPHGIRTARPSAMDRFIDAGQAPLVARTHEEFARMLSLLFERMPFLPYPVLRRARGAAVRQADSNMRIWLDQLKDRYLLHETLAQLRKPLAVIWGGKDKVFDVSGLEAVRALQPAAFIHEVADAGHLPMMETPARSAALYLDFLDRSRHPR
jgi:pimeloyl-ACP methyl ester carboxylesterase